ncbi:MAG: hypothetical protein ACXAB7_11210, partial [Candidatus Kariarchaeaceae archaeon]
MQSEGSYSQSDIIGSLLFVLLSFFVVIWVVVDQDPYIQLALGVLAILTVILYYQRVIRLPLDVRAPLGDTLVILAGFNISSFFFLEALDLKNSGISGISLGFTPQIAFILLTSGIITKLFLLDELLKELNAHFNRITSQFYEWLIVPLNWVRSVLVLSAVFLYSLKDVVEQDISNENVGLVSILLFSTAIILSSLEPWKRGS